MLNNIQLEIVDHVKFLGIVIDNNFVWDRHLQKLRGKVSKAIGAIYRIRKKVDEKILLLLYNTLVLSHLNYCAEIWGNTYDSRLKELIILQKRVIRIVGNLNYREHTGPVFKKHGILKLKDLIKFKTGIFMYNTHRRKVPGNILDNFALNSDIHTYDTRHKYDFHVPSVSKQIKFISTNNKGIRYWNELPLDIKECASVELFKRKLKKKLLSDY